MSIEDLTIEKLMKVVKYDPSSGAIWRLGWYSRAGTYIAYPEPRLVSGVGGNGYIQVVVCGLHLTAHRLAWFITHGEWPIGVDHINGDRTDNRLCNLRAATQAQNTQNIREPKSHNTSGYLGVSWDKARGKFTAGISINGKRRGLGRFDKAEDAHAAYLAAKRKYHSHSTL